MDLQLFAEERTEEATPRKLRKAREEGRAPRSTDLMNGIGLVVAAMTLRALGPSFYEQVAGALTEAFSNLQPDVTPGSTSDLFQSWSLFYLKTLLPLAGIILSIGVAVGLIQTGFLFSLKPLTPDFNRINPVSGMQRLFSLRTLVEVFKGFLKIGIIGYIAYSQVMPLIQAAPNLLGQSVALGITTMASKVVSTLMAIGFGLLALGILDYGYQYWEFRKSIRMTKQEVKQENKENEGNPEQKQRQRQRQRELAMRRRAIKNVPTADVVITNPTHYAIALQYRPEEGGAPLVVAKGADLLALRIKAVAKQYEVPMVENRPLARTLYDTVEIGKAIPPELYQAVAEVLAFVYSVRRQNRRQQL